MLSEYIVSQNECENHTMFPDFVCREFMENEYINRPPEVNKVFEKYVGDQKGLQMKRKEMLEQLREFKVLLLIIFR